MKGGRVRSNDELAKYADGGYPNSKPVNVLGFADKLLGPETDFVSPNNDTLYMALEADVTREPLVLHVPDGMTLVRAPTNIFRVVGRYAVDGEPDIPNVQALQKQTGVTPLSRYSEPPDNSGRKHGDWDLAPCNRNVDEELAWWKNSAPG
ncbi:MAG: DUF1254 domain-containing protein [Proteobacteria bacterium]|nr:DUF1254 domain-containing protein [Pseudomonadota bacterium]